MVYSFQSNFNLFRPLFTVKERNYGNCSGFFLFNEFSEFTERSKYFIFIFTIQFTFSNCFYQIQSEEFFVIFHWKNYFSHNIKLCFYVKIGRAQMFICFCLFRSSCFFLPLDYHCHRMDLYFEMSDNKGTFLEFRFCEV